MPIPMQKGEVEAAAASLMGYRLENTNPCRDVHLNRRRACNRYLTVEELERLGTVLLEQREKEEGVHVSAAAAITLLLLTGCRRSEVLGLQWQDVKGHRIKLRDSKTGPRTVWLGDEAKAVIASVPRTRNVAWVFWNPSLSKPIRDLQHYWTAIRERAGLGDVRLHDLRHTFASHAAMQRETLPMIGRLLGHAKPQSTSRYAHLGEQHLIEAAEQIGAAVNRLIAMPSGGYEVA